MRLSNTILHSTINLLDDSQNGKKKGKTMVCIFPLINLKINMEDNLDIMSTLLFKRNEDLSIFDNVISKKNLTFSSCCEKFQDLLSDRHLARILFFFLLLSLFFFLFLFLLIFNVIDYASIFISIFQCTTFFNVVHRVGCSTIVINNVCWYFKL